MYIAQAQEDTERLRKQVSVCTAQRYLHALAASYFKPPGSKCEHSQHHGRHAGH